MVGVCAGAEERRFPDPKLTGFCFGAIFGEPAEYFADIRTIEEPNIRISDLTPGT
jgi:hypothetical protein